MILARRYRYILEQNRKGMKSPTRGRRTGDGDGIGASGFDGGSVEMMMKTTVSTTAAARTYTVLVEEE